MPTSLKEVPEIVSKVKTPHEVSVSVPEVEQPVAITKPFRSPADWRDHWIYFLMIDRFNNPAGPPKHQWDKAVIARQGGTFEGVREKLPYIKGLGAGAIWLTPVLKNRQSTDDGSYHGYGVMDLLEVDPRLGSTPANAEAEFIRLVDEAHAVGLHVILDIVINHCGDLFAYLVDGNIKDSAGWSDQEYPIYWRDENGNARADWQKLPSPDSLPRDAGVWPTEFQRNDFFRRHGEGGPIMGDFYTLKDFETELRDEFGDKPVWNAIIRAYQCAVAKFDVDGFRIDTLKHVEHEFALTFSNAIREFAYSIGKKNFFIFGETKDNEQKIAEYVGRYTSEEEGRIGADASLDFPLQWKLCPALKGYEPPTIVEDVYNLRREVQKSLLSTHGEASRFFVTFLDNHDDNSRFLYPASGGDFTRQLTMGLGCLFGLQGIPCLYYGTEQGLKGTQELYPPGGGGAPEHVREALWGMPNAFDGNHSLYKQISLMSRIKNNEPALRYGRQYFRQVSGNNVDFGPSKEKGGLIAFSRILNDREIVIVANSNTSSAFEGWVVVDARLHDQNVKFMIAYSNCGNERSENISSGDVTFYSREGVPSPGWARRVHIELSPMEVQMLVPEWMFREMFP